MSAVVVELLPIFEQRERLASARVALLTAGVDHFGGKVIELDSAQRRAALAYGVLAKRLRSDLPAGLRTVLQRLQDEASTIYWDAMHEQQELEAARAPVLRLLPGLASGYRYAPPANDAA